MFIFIDLHADSNHYWCISERIKAFAYAFYYWNFQYSFPIHYLTWNRLSCSFGNIEEREGGGKGNCIKLCPTRSYSRLRLRKKKKNIPPPFFFFDFNGTITHPRKNLFKRDGEILQSINRLFPDKTLQVSLVNPSFRLKILSRIFLSLFPFFFSLSKKRVIVNCTKFPSPSHILSPSMIHIAKNSKNKTFSDEKTFIRLFVSFAVSFDFLSFLR